MRISHGTRIQNINPTNGYGYATDRMAWALGELGHEFVQNDPDAPVQMWFDQPQHWKWNDSDQYRVGYHPWESTRLKPKWDEYMNQCDEVWTPSPLIAQWYVEHAGIKKPVYVYEHGVDDIWAPKKRKVEDKIRFLHVGLEAARKGGHETMRAFRKAFQGRDDVELTLKMISPGFNVPAWGNVHIINRTMKIDQLVDVFHDHHVYIYPSWGEGFGLTPLQAIATGMPTITLPAWAPYAKHLDPELCVNSQMMRSPWPKVHPGEMLAPSVDDIIDRLRYSADNYEALHARALDRVDAIRDEYDWLKLTKNAFDGLENRLKK